MSLPSLQRSRPVALPIIAVLLAGACSMIDMSRAPPPDWPKLEIIRVASKDLVPYCGWTMLACANINFDTMRCTVYATDELALEHELEHCKGRDHIGTSEIRDYWETWKKGRR